MRFDWGVCAQPAAQDVVISLDSVTIRRGETEMLRTVSWSVSRDERWVILGPNGAGKTTMLQIASAQLHPTTGTVHLLGERLGGVDVFELRPRLGFASAAIAARLPLGETALDTVMSAGYAVLGRWRERYDAIDTVRAYTLLDQLGVVHLAHRTFGTLSEGERKRVQIARALMPDPEVLLLDEPAAGLDLAGREDLVARLGTLADDLAAPVLVLVTHHVEEIPAGFTHALLMRDGGVVAAGELDDALNEDTLAATFGIKLWLARRRGRWFAQADS